MTPSYEALRELVERVERATTWSNRLDVEVEVALFEPDTLYSAAHPNAAHTKVVYTRLGGGEAVHWARDYTANDVVRADTVKRLRALLRAKLQEKEG